MTLAQHVSERGNLITPVRLMLAAIVAVWHGIVLAGPNGGEFSIHGLSPSYMAVNGFFILSGFLIARSAESRDLAYYAAARILRLFPALIALLAWGLCFTVLLHAADPDMANAPGDWLYPLKALLFMDASGTFPGLFADNARSEFSLSLWTLRYEALAYLALPAALALGLLARPLRAWALWAAAALGFCAIDYFPDAPAIAHEGLRLAAGFLLGAAIHVSRHWLRAGPLTLAAALGAAVLLQGTHFFEAAADLVLAWALFFVCFPAKTGLIGRVTAPLARIPDWSYGLYIWHWPVFQTLKMVFPEAGAGALLGWGLALSLIVAAISWHLLERPALGAKDAVAAWLRGLRLPAGRISGAAGAA